MVERQEDMTKKQRDVMEQMRAEYREYRDILNGIDFDTVFDQLGARYGFNSQDQNSLLKQERVDWHFPLERRSKPPTPEEQEKIRKEVAEYIEQYKQEYRQQQKALAEKRINQQEKEADHGKV